MGCSSPQNAALPNIPQTQIKRLLQTTDLNHPLNINKKYEYLARIEPKQEVGTGYKKTYAYYALTNKQDLQAKRKQFWQTRTSGQPAIWQALRDSISIKDPVLAEELLKSHRLYLMNGIQLCLDARYSKYQIPIFCINEPISYTVHREDQNLKNDYVDQTFEVTIRSAKYPNGDIKISQRTSTQVGLIKQSLMSLKNLSSETKIRFFYTGREMKDDKTIGNYGYMPGTVIQAMIM